MISYMPFTYIEEKNIPKITGALGPVAVCGLVPEVVPDHMQPWVEKRMLDLWYPHGIHAERLRLAMAEFKAWADMHGGSIADMASFHKMQQGFPPLVDETHPTRIGDQIRHFGEPADGNTPDPVFQPALFIYMAHEYDRQHDAVNQGLGKVLAMERAMQARLFGDAREIEAGTSPIGRAIHSAAPSDVGARMTAERVRAWARLAGTNPRSCSVFITSSPAVLEHLLEMFPEARGPLSPNPAVAHDRAHGVSGIRLDDILEALSMADHAEPLPPSLGNVLLRSEAAADLKIYPLAGISPPLFLERLCGAASEPTRTTTGTSQPASVNTLIGMLNLA